MKPFRLLAGLLIMSILFSLCYPAGFAKAEQTGGGDLPQIVNREGYYQIYFLVPETFAEDLGTWTIAPYTGSFRGKTLYGRSDGNVGAARPANAALQIAEAGTYYVWAHTREFDTSPGTRQFKIRIGETTLPYAFGSHTTNGWLWEKGGAVQLSAGQSIVSLLDTSARFARVDAILLTTDPEYAPEADYNALKTSLANPRAVEPPPAAHNIFLRPESFRDLGTWNMEAYTGSMGGVNLIGIKTPDGTVFDPATAKPAVAAFQAPGSGTYKVWVRSRNFSVSPGTRFFEVDVNQSRLGKQFGKTGTNGWVWEDGGTVDLQAGTNTLQLVDASGFYARTDGVLLTTDMNLSPPADYESMLGIARPAYPFEDRLVYPGWAKTDAAPSQTYVLDNGHVRVEFYSVSTPEGNVIQKRTSLMHEGQYVPVESRTDEFGYLLLHGDEARLPRLSELSPVFDATVTQDGNPVRVLTLNAFHGGYPSWMIPSGMEQIAPDKVILASENDLVRLEAEWSLPADGKEPVVTLRLEPKVNGAFSIGMFGGAERPLDQIDYLLNPLRYHGKRMPVDPVLLPEQSSTAASSYMTFHGRGDVANGMEVTFAVAVDPSSISDRWAYDDNSEFGLGIMGRNRGVQPSLFAPLMGMPDSGMEAGETFTFTYRPVIMLDSWFNAHKHVTEQILGLYDYRKNTEASLTDTIFNVQDLLMNDEFGGWDPIMKSFYNMEAENVVSSGSPLALLQSYMLSEDPDVYEKRVLPTLEYLLTRKSMHFTSTGNTRGSPVLRFPNPLPIGSPTAGFGSSVFGGAFKMTGGLSPSFRTIGIDGNLKGSANTPEWAEYAWLYKYTGETSYLNKAKEGADRYLTDVVYKAPVTVPNFDTFILLSYFPNFNALLDLYEISGEQKYLDAAVYSARQLITDFRSYPVPAGQKTILADDVRANALPTNTLFNWRGDHQIHLGYPERLDDLQDVTVPAWISSPVGLGIEQSPTFLWTNSGFIHMSNWAPDMMRLSELTGDGTFEMFARNAVLGRGANYPGYYLNQYMNHYTKADFPYTGPDLTSIYYHHIPVYYGILTDFLISQTWNWSNRNIDFPYLRQQGYAYFYNRVFGYEPGTFFDQQDMWLWLKKGLLTTDNIQIDWVGARKDGVFAAALMNEDSVPVTAAVQFGEELGGGGLNGPVTLYDANGNQTAAYVSEGKLTVTVPARGLIGVVMANPMVKAPGFASVDPADAMTRTVGETAAVPASAADFGYGNVLQVDPSYYHAYVYTTDMANATARTVLHYRIGDGEWKQQESAVYPYEFTVKVENPEAPFRFYMEVFRKDGTVKTSLEKTLRAYSSERAITGFQTAGQIGGPIILPQLRTVTAFVYGGTDVTAMTPAVTVSDKATVVSPTGSVDFTQPVKYTLRAENGLNAEWTVMVVPIGGWNSLFTLIGWMKEAGWFHNDNEAAEGLLKSLEHRNPVSVAYQIEGLLKGNKIAPEAGAILERALYLVK